MTMFKKSVIPIIGAAMLLSTALADSGSYMVIKGVTSDNSESAKALRRIEVLSYSFGSGAAKPAGHGPGSMQVITVGVRKPKRCNASTAMESVSQVSP